MRLFGRYLWLELKRSFQILKKTILNFILVIAILVTGITAVSYTMMQSQVFQQVEVGVVAPGEDSITQIVVQFISAMKSVRSVCNFRYMDEETATEALEDGDLQAVILLPVNFYEDVDSGKNTPAKILLPKDSGLNVKVFQELLRDGVSLLQTAEAGVYATYEVLREDDPVMNSADIGDFLAEQYTLEALERQKLFEEQMVSPFGDMISTQYYYLSVCLIILLMAGLNMGYLYRKQSRAVEQKLMIYGLRGWNSAVLKMIVMTLFLYFLALLLYGAGILLTRYTPLELVYWYPDVLAGMLLLCIAISVYFHMIYVLTDGGVQGVSVLLAVNVVMILASGLILPESYFPKWVQCFGSVMPLRIWTEYAMEVLFDQVTVMSAVRLLAITGIELGIGGIALCRKS